MPRMSKDRLKELMSKLPEDCTPRELRQQRRICGYTLDAAAAMIRVAPVDLHQWETGQAKPSLDQCQMIRAAYRLGQEYRIPLPVESIQPTPWAVVCSKGCNRGLPIFMHEAAYDYACRQDNKPWTCPRCGSEATFTHHEMEEEKEDEQQW